MLHLGANVDSVGRLVDTNPIDLEARGFRWHGLRMRQDRKRKAKVRKPKAAPSG